MMMLQNLYYVLGNKENPKIDPIFTGYFVKILEMRRNLSISQNRTFFRLLAQFLVYQTRSKSDSDILCFVIYEIVS